MNFCSCPPPHRNRIHGIVNGVCRGCQKALPQGVLENMLRFELAGTPGNHVTIDPDAVASVCEGKWPTAGKSILSGAGQEKLVATLCMIGAGGANNGGNWTVADPSRTVAKQIEEAKKGNPLR